MIHYERIEGATKEGLEAASAMLMIKLRQLVSIQTGMDGPGSPMGSPPYRRTGAGQDTIDYAEISGDFDFGFEIGSLAIPEGAKVNYMAVHDQSGRPWISTAAERYKPELLAIIRRHVKMAV